LVEGRKEAQFMYFTVHRATLAAYHRELGRRVGLK
jgi:hypothetical protein